MDSQKRENLLNLALNSTEGERERSLNLNVGFNEAEKVWTLIVKYVEPDNGMGVRPENVAPLWMELDEMGVIYTILLGNYAILQVPESRLDQVTALEEIIFIEKPKRLNFAENIVIK